MLSCKVEELFLTFFPWHLSWLGDFDA